jgi:hypothetical protein
MSFELIDVQAMFQRIINTILEPLLDQEVVVYLDNMLIYIMTMKAHQLLV